MILETLVASLIIHSIAGGEKKVKCPKCPYTAESSLVGRHLEGSHGGVACKECKLVLESRDE